MAGVAGRPGYGGARAGSGRPRKAVKFGRPIAAAEKQIADRLPSIIEKLFELGDGITVQETAANGDVRIYERPPDREALKYLVDRILGRPKERLDAELTGRAGGPIVITEVVVERPKPAEPVE